MRLYATEWCSCTYESNYALESLHDTEAGAEAALAALFKKRDAKEKEMHDAGYPTYRESSDGRVRCVEVLTQESTSE